MSIKGLKLKGGKVVIQEKEKDLRVRKNYSLPQQRKRIRIKVSK